MSRMKVSLEGNIGVGKSVTLQRAIDNGVVSADKVFLEPVAEWRPFLHDFYDRPNAGSSLALALAVVRSYTRPGVYERHDLFERGPHSARDVFGPITFDGAQEHRDLFYDYTADAWSPDVSIYLRASPATCMRRIKTRRRDCESNINFEYIEKLYDSYEKAAEVGEVYVVDAEMSESDVQQAFEKTLVNLWQRPVVLAQ